jgi:hypothetical protein
MRTDFIINSGVGFIDAFEIGGYGMGHDPRPGLEWNKPVILNGEAGEILDNHDPYFIVARFWERGPGIFVKRSDVRQP